MYYRSPDTSEAPNQLIAVSEVKVQESQYKGAGESGQLCIPVNLMLNSVHAKTV